MLQDARYWFSVLFLQQLIISQHKKFYFIVSFSQNDKTVSRSYKSSHQRCSIKTVLLKISQISQENTCAGVSFQLYQKETPAQVFSREICEIFKNTYFEEHMRTTASVAT